MELSQAEADLLLRMEKRAREEREYNLPGLGKRLNVPIESFDGREHFHLDLFRGRVSLHRRTFQHRARQTVILARLDFNSPHLNPDGIQVGVPHLHLYKEGYGDKWAEELPRGWFTNIEDPHAILDDFLRFCMISQPPPFRGDLFS